MTDTSTADDVLAQEAEDALDRRLKQRQLAKLEAEIKGLSRFSFETLAKLIVGILAIAAAAATFYLGIPQAKLDLLKLHQELLDKTEEAKREAAKAGDATALRLRAMDEVNQLQAQAKLIAEQNALLQAASGKTATKAEQLRNAEIAKPRVFIQFAGSINRERVIEPLRRALTDAGLVAPPAERINRGQNNEVRYFSPDKVQQDLATKVAETTLNSLKASECPLANLQAHYHELPNGKQGPIELWLMLNCPGSRGEAP